MYSISEQEYYGSLGLLLSEKDGERLSLHLKELIGLCISKGEAEELSILEGLQNDPKALKKVQRKLKAGSVLHSETVRGILEEQKSGK